MNKATKWVLSLAVLGTAGAPVAYLAAFESETGRREEAALRKIRALGHATSLTEYRAAEPENNAIDEWLEQLTYWNEGADHLPLHPFKPDGSVSPEMRAYVKQRQTRIDVLSRLEAFPNLWEDPNSSSPLSTARLRYWMASLHAAALIESEVGGADKAWRRARTLAHIARLEAESNVARAAFSPVVELSGLAYAMAARSPSLQERQRWEAWLKQNDVPYDPRKRIGPVTIAARKPEWFSGDAASQGFKDREAFLFNLEFVRKRIRLYEIERIADLAEALEGGQVTRQELLVVLTRADKRAKENEMLGPMAKRLKTSPIRYSEVVRPLDYFRSPFVDQHLLLMELIVEIAGGPEAREIPGAHVEREPGVIFVKTPDGNKWRIDKTSMRQLER